MSKKYSIILPVKNGGEYVKICVDSILKQTYRDFNLIILDNNSNDGSLEWLQALADERVVIYTSAQSLSMEENWGRIVAVPKNEFITIIGHDDLLHPGYLETMDALIAKHPQASLYQAHFKFIDAQGALVRHCQPMAEMQNADEFLTCQINRTLDSTGTGYMMRSSDYDALGGISTMYPNLIFADYELWMKLTMKSYKATAAAEVFSYRLHNSVSKLTNGEEYVQAFGRYMLFLAESRKKNKAIATTLDLYGRKMLLYLCQAMSHRLLKTSRQKRKTTVGDFIASCRVYASILIPGQSFSPLLAPGILAARILDNTIGLKLFALYKKTL
ncbi:glycosyltransferase [Ferruginibacter lapsinanis]|uniref:glycosyltransferase family 2 protein n=1 Tax=Ferruginibacter lapsinanis TaxID=563172 RepID=UPI001E4305C8|nr:glycosyltransferase [Ferruginibacter lapsinanis]UEG49052.1 glycosyltransferase [Ferruginibacter lapsinanis]